MPKPPPDIDAENVIRFLTEPHIAAQLTEMVCHKLHDLEGFPDLPMDLRTRIEEVAALIYGAGYLHAVKHGRYD
jgi:hypothetical protein